MKPIFPANIYVMTVLTQAKNDPGIRKSLLYTTPAERNVVDCLIDSDMLECAHPTLVSSSISITPLGEELLEALEDAVSIMSMSVLAQAEIERMTERNKAINKIRAESARTARDKKLGKIPGLPKDAPRILQPPSNIKDYICHNGTYYYKDDYIQLFGEPKDEE